MSLHHQHWTLEKYIDFALLLAGSPFTEGLLRRNTAILQYPPHQNFFTSQRSCQESFTSCLSSQSLLPSCLSSQSLLPSCLPSQRLLKSCLPSRGWHRSGFSNLSRPTPTEKNLVPSQSHEKTGGKSCPVPLPEEWLPFPPTPVFFFLGRNLSVTVKI